MLILYRSDDESFNKSLNGDPDPDTNHLRGGPSHGNKS